MLRRILSLICCLLIATPIFSEEQELWEDLFPSTPDQIATLTSEPDYLVGGLISPLSGQPALRQTDLIAKGAQNIVLSRIYIPPYMPCHFPKHKHQQEEYNKKHLWEHLQSNYKGWQFNPHTGLILNRRTLIVRLSEPSGMTLDFRLPSHHFPTSTLISPPYAITNTAGDTPSGKYDPRNIRITYEDNRITVYAADGTIRSYCTTGWINKPNEIFFLEKEILPNGKILKYHYTNTLLLRSVESWDSKERYLYAFMHIAGSRGAGNHHFTSSSGMTADYTYERRPVHWTIKAKKEKGKIRKRKSKQEVNAFLPPLLSSVSSPFYRHESLEYCNMHMLGYFSGKEDIFRLFHIGFGEGEQHYRVHELRLPVQSDQYVPVYTFCYQPPVAGQKAGTTTVKNSDGTSTVYHFSSSILPTAIQYFGQDGNLKKEKIIAWTENHWLQSIEIRDGYKNRLYRRSYEQYDSFGNPLLEIFTGDLTGDGQASYTIKREFSQDGRNLLLREESEDGKVLCFSYLPQTNLVTSKLTKDVDKIILREFSLYDDCNNLIQKISDDGTTENRDDLFGVTQRILTLYTLRQSAPFLHMPEWIEEKYWEAGIEKPLKKTHLLYDEHGNIAREEVYDAEGRHAYTLCKTYNECGDVLTETNRLGQEAVYTYDMKGRPDTSTNFSHRLETKFHHDTKGRLCQQTEKGEDGIVHITSSGYDFQDRQIFKKDLFQNTTSYTYDPLVSKVVRTDFPPISIEGQLTPVVTDSSFDSFGRELTRTDPNGNTTTYRYNAYGSPLEILYPNGGKEHFRYAKNGQLASHTDPDGLTIYYKRDVLGRVLSKTYISAEGKTLAEEVFTYNGFNLLTETDKEGNVKKYSHDGAGRKIREEFCGHITDFGYDSLGELTTICQQNGDNTLLTHYKRDLEGKILEEHRTDASGHVLYKLSYSYDKDSNQETITRYIHGKEAVDTFAYDSFHRQVQEKDANNYLTTTVYDENFTNSLDQKVLQIAITDPRQITSIETKDALDRTVKKEILNPQGATLSCQEMSHDPQGNLLCCRDHVYEGEHFRNTQTVKCTYTPGNQIESLTRAFGTSDARTTAYTYFPSRKLATKTLPDGVVLAYGYNSLGFISRLDSSDGNIHHLFEHDRLGYLRYALDENQNIAIEREVDPFGNVTQEIFPSGLRVNKDYDHFNRLISLKMASHGEVLYTYDPMFLRSVTRTSGKGELLYAHTYEDYDWGGNLIAEDLIGNLGQIIHTTDPGGQKASIFSPWFSQECHYDPAYNLIRSVTDGVEHLYSYDGLSQLSSEHSSHHSLAYAHDSLYNRTEKNGKKQGINDLNELLSPGDCHCTYDLSGNQSLKQTPDETFRFTYDSLNRLIEAVSEKKKVNFAYDPLARRLSKVVCIPTDRGWKETVHEHYLYHGQNEIGAFVSCDKEPINLRVLGLAKHKDSPATVGIEIDGQVFAPILDVQGNICRLIDLETRSIASRYDFTAFGEKLETSTSALFNPWRFASKRFDPELGLIYFGKRFYDPRFGRWLTTDPAGFVDSVNLYQYVFNNPFLYEDLDGQFAFVIPLLIWGAEFALPSLSAVAIPAIYGAMAGAVAYGGYKAVQALNAYDHSRYFVENHQAGREDYSSSMQRKKKGGVDETLSVDPFNDPNLEDVSHPKAREKGHYQFRDKETGEIIEYDKGKPGQPGHKGHDHYHRPNPNRTGKDDWYLDSERNPVPDRSESSHLYPSEWVWW